MVKTFSVQITNNPETLLEKAGKIASKHGVKLQGDMVSGFFEGHGVEGKYKVEGDIMQVTIHKKPLIAPWSLVKSKVKGFFE
jgi:hypothetical protein